MAISRAARAVSRRAFELRRVGVNMSRTGAPVADSIESRTQHAFTLRAIGTRTALVQHCVGPLAFTHVRFQSSDTLTVSLPTAAARAECEELCRTNSAEAFPRVRFNFLISWKRLKRLPFYNID